MGRDDEQVDSMEIDDQKQQQLEAPAAVPEGFNTDYLRVYYGKLFPYGDFFKWLCYGNDGKHPGYDQSYVGRREFSFTLENDIYLRFQSFDSATELESSIKEKCPFKIDIGPVYSVDPSKRHAYAQCGTNVFVPVERELIFDIDISDYDDVHYCCSGADVCLDCWPLMTIAIKILDTSLRDDFGFSHILWVYSGRRGVHCWVCDSRARKLSNEQRAAIADYFRVYKGGENALKKVSLAGPVLHPFLAYVLTVTSFCLIYQRKLCYDGSSRSLPETPNANQTSAQTHAVDPPISTLPTPQPQQQLAIEVWAPESFTAQPLEANAECTHTSSQLSTVEQVGGATTTPQTSENQTENQTAPEAILPDLGLENFIESISLPVPQPLLQLELDALAANTPTTSNTRSRMHISTPCSSQRKSTRLAKKLK